MNRPSDEMLNAYVDGALDDATANEVAAYLAHNADAQSYVDELRRVNALAADALDTFIPGPTPQALIDSVMSAPINVPSIAQYSRNEPRQRRNMPATRYLMPMAAALVVTFGLGLTYALIGQDDLRAGLLPTGPTQPGSALAGILDKGRTGDAPVAITGIDGSAMTASIAATFRDKTGRYCREIDVLGGEPASPLSASIACRDGPGAWLIEGSVKVSGNDTSVKPGYEPSGSQDNEPLAGLLDSLGIGQALTGTEEAAAISGDWK